NASSRLELPHLLLVEKWFHRGLLWCHWDVQRVMEKWRSVHITAVRGYGLLLRRGERLDCPVHRCDESDRAGDSSCDACGGTEKADHAALPVRAADAECQILAEAFG